MKRSARITAIALNIHAPGLMDDLVEEWAKLKEKPQVLIDALIEAWRGFIDGKGLRHTNDDHEYEICHSPALTFLERLVKGLRTSVSEAISSEEAWTLNRLETMLRGTPGLVHRRQEAPANETELQKIMHDYLSACFPDFRRNPVIGGTLKNFKPDCGIASVGAAIEFKIVHTKDQVTVAFSGIAEDTAGYKGSKDWTRFYSVIPGSAIHVGEPSSKRFEADRRGHVDTDRREWTHCK
jgi:hypothetical protein